MKILKQPLLVLIAFTALIMLNGCSLFYSGSHRHGFSSYCYKVEKSDTAKINSVKKWDVDRMGFKAGDSILSIGVGSGWREFLYSIFTDSVTFFLEDIDTSCVSNKRIINVYLPYYTDMRGSAITNTFVPVLGTEISVETGDGLFDKVLITNAYHHFGDDIAMVKECNRILKMHGKLIISEHVMKRNKRSRKFCTAGGNYKSEANFVKDIVEQGFRCDTIFRDGEYARLFIFTKR